MKSVTLLLFFLSGCTHLSFAEKQEVCKEMFEENHIPLTVDLETLPESSYDVEVGRNAGMWAGCMNTLMYLEKK